ncbi:unnamed protein product [Vicia faba]|uniref:Uncharacterized protein n=1 Tax=Vicia faba TaxID=3906 RepID=A0AAV0Z6K0_VICFA|nr:unnamed protein product [Vicia faba]
MFMSTSASFSDLVTIGERIKRYIRTGKIQGSFSTISISNEKLYFSSGNKKEGESSTAIIGTLAYSQVQAPNYETLVIRSNRHASQTYVTVSTKQSQVARQQPVPQSFSHPH